MKQKIVDNFDTSVMIVLKVSLIKKIIINTILKNVKLI